MTKQTEETKTDQWGNEIQEQTEADRKELQRIRETGERLNYASAGAVRRR
jgi:G:T-mismatch repair DNA endonuclease (very short patch repair protein)